MKNTLKKISNIFLTAISIFSGMVLLWIALSTAEIAIIGTMGKKASAYNMFMLSDTIKDTNNFKNSDMIPQIYSDDIFEDGDTAEDENEDEEIINLKL